MSRERLVALLWPEADEERGRQILRQTLYALRRSSGADDIVLGTTELRLNETRIVADAAEFEGLLAARETASALALYTGPFLDGVHIRASAEFENWVDSQRLALQQLHQHTWVAHCDATGREGDARATLRAWEGFAALYPTHGKAAAGLLHAHLAQGDRAGAVLFGRLHERLLHDEAGVAPDAIVRRLIVEAATDEATGIATAVSSYSVAPQAGSRPQESKQPEAAGAPDIAPARPAELRVPMPVGSPTSSRRGTRRLIAAGGVSVLGVLALLFGQKGWSRGVGAAPAASVYARIAVFPFEHSGPGKAAGPDLSVGVAALLGAGLDGAAGLTISDASAVSRSLGGNPAGRPADSLAAIARRLGADLFLMGTIVTGSDGSLSLSGSLHEARSGARVAGASARGNANELFRLSDEISRALLGQRFGSSVTERLSGAAARTTTSLAAFRSFLAGEAHFRAGRHAQAVEEYLQAIADDSSFALAHYRLSIGADWIGDGTLMMRAAGEAVRHGTRLGPREQLLVKANHAWRRGAIDEAERQYGELVRLYPDDALAWFELGEVQFHSSPVYGRTVWAAARSFEHVLRLDSTNTDALEHLARVLALYGHPARAESLLARAIKRRPAGGAEIQRGLLALVSGRQHQVDAMLDSASGWSKSALFMLAPQAAAYARRLDVADELAQLLAAPPASEASRIDAAMMRAEFAATQGKPRAAMRIVQVAASEARATWAPGVRARIASLPGVVLTSDEITQVRADLRGWMRSSVDTAYGNSDDIFLSPGYGAYLDGLLAIAQHDVPGANAAAAELVGLPGDSARRALTAALSRGIRAHVSFHEGRLAEALDLLEQPRPDTWLYGGGHVTQFVPERFLRGRVLAALGRDPEALPWLESCGQAPRFDISCIAPSMLERARIHERRGQVDSARVLYLQLVDLWRDAEPSLHHVRTQVVARVRALETGRRTR